MTRSTPLQCRRRLARLRGSSSENMRWTFFAPIFSVHITSMRIRKLFATRVCFSLVVLFLWKRVQLCSKMNFHITWLELIVNSPNSTWLVTSVTSRHDTTRSTCQAHAFWLYRACQTTRLDTLVSTHSTNQTCCVLSLHDLMSYEPSGIWAYLFWFYSVVLWFGNRYEHCSIQNYLMQQLDNAPLFHFSLHGLLMYLKRCILHIKNLNVY